MRMPRPDPIRILLVEDDEDDYTIVCDRLSDLFASGSSLAWVRDYDEALEALSSDLFDVCLLDYRLGERSGMELLEQATRRGSTTPILFLTGTGNYEIDFAAMKMGAADYLTKDELSTTLLERAMRYAIEIRRKNEELLQSRLSSERKEAELALRESEVRYKLVMEATNDGIWDWNIKTGEVLRNSAYFAMLGYEENELGSDIEKWHGLIHPDDIDAVSRVLHEHLAGKIKTYDIEYRMVHKSGRAVWVHSRGKTVAFDEEGNPTRMVGTIADITGRKRIEQELRESEQRYRELFEAGSDAILFIEAATERILEANGTAAAMFGYSREELLTKKNWEISEEPEQTRRKTRGASLVPGRVITVPLRYLRRKDGTVFPAEITGRSFFWQERPVFIASIRDITERRSAEQERENLQAQLNQAQKLESVGRLAGGVAHDFNNMLGVILGHVEMALDQVDEAETLHMSLTEIRKAAMRSAELTRQLLAFARRQTISPQILDLNETVEGMLKMLRRLIGENIDLVWLPAKNIWPVMVDPGQIDQVLANLCVNARDAISGTGKVSIETGITFFDEEYCFRTPGVVPGEFVFLDVSDSGCGMEEEILGKIFEPFFTTKAVGEGTGLGLATVYGIVKQNSGFINVYSESGRGTTFKIYLPRAEAQTEQKPPVLPARDLRGTETVLLVEDEGPMLALGKTILERHGYTVLAAASPVQALGLVQNHDGPIDLLITDVVMPEMNGKDLRDELVRLAPELKTIFMSGYTADIIAHHGILEEGIAFLQKPFSVKTLLEKVRDVLVP